MFGSFFTAWSKAINIQRAVSQSTAKHDSSDIKEKYMFIFINHNYFDVAMVTCSHSLTRSLKFRFMCQIVYSLFIHRIVYLYVFVLSSLFEQESARGISEGNKISSNGAILHLTM